MTIPSCWYLWPDSSQAEHTGPHAAYEEYAEHEENAEGDDLVHFVARDFAEFMRLVFAKKG